MSSRSLDVYDCPQCGEETPTLHEGYCEECRKDNQHALDRFNEHLELWRAAQ